MPEELKLSEPLAVEMVDELTKPREDGKRPWSRNWRVQVPHRFREHILRPEAIPEPTDGNKRQRPSPKQVAAVQAAGGQAQPDAALPQIGDPDYLPVGHENHRKQ